MKKDAFYDKEDITFHEPQTYLAGDNNNECMLSESSSEASEQEQEPEIIPQASQTLFRL